MQVIVNMKEPITSSFVKRHVIKETKEFLGLGRLASKKAVKQSFNFQLAQEGMSEKQIELIKRLNPVQAHQVETGSASAMEMFGYLARVFN